MGCNRVLVGGVVAVLASFAAGPAQASYLEMPAVPARKPNLEISAGCEHRERVVSLLAQLSTRNVSSADGNVVPARLVVAGSDRYVVFGRPPKGQEPSLKTMISCLTIYAGGPPAVRALGLYVPDDTVPVGWFTYSPKLGIYADPRTVTLFPNR